MRPVFLITLILFSLGCKKEEPENSQENCIIVHEEHNNDTLRSSSYIAAYPGSTWSYSNNQSSSCYISKALVYSPLNVIFGCSHIIEDRVILPENILIGKIDSIYEVVTDEDNYTTELIPILDIEYGEFYYKKEYKTNQNPETIATYRREVIGIYDSLEVGGAMYYDLIKVKHSVIKVSTNGNTFNTEKFYTYANNIGLVRYQFPLESQDIHLTGYYINE